MWKRDANTGALVRGVTGEELRVQMLERRVEQVEEELRELKNLLLSRSRSRLCCNCCNFKFLIKKEEKEREDGKV